MMIIVVFWKHSQGLGHLYGRAAVPLFAQEHGPVQICEVHLHASPCGVFRSFVHMHVQAYPTCEHVDASHVSVSRLCMCCIDSCCFSVCPRSSFIFIDKRPVACMAYVCTRVYYSRVHHGHVEGLLPEF